MINQTRPALGKFLEQQRLNMERSLRWVETQTKKLYPNSPIRQLSNPYIKMIESGDQKNIHPLKLQTLAKIYNVDYLYLLDLAGILDNTTNDLNEQFLSKFKMLNEEQQKSVLTTIDLMLKK